MVKICAKNRGEILEEQTKNTKYGKYVHGADTKYSRKKKKRRCWESSGAGKGRDQAVTADFWAERSSHTTR